MELETLDLQHVNKVMQAYSKDDEFIHTFFDYKNEGESYPARLKELSERPFNRNGVSEVIHSFMEPFGISEKALAHIKELSENGVAVIGGQQAGILTGPLYSIHKAITVLLLAEQKSKELSVPVVPVFWVAGEDHDLNEINHVYTETSGKLTKQKYREKFVFKLMASDAAYTDKEMVGFIKDTFRQFGETVHTRKMLDTVLAAVQAEQTFTGFFVRLMNGLFREEGLLFIDSAYKPLRELEKDHFGRFIEESEEIARLIVDKEQQFDDLGFGQPIQAESDAANLFYIHETGRVLLSREEGAFINKSTGIRFTRDELLEVATEEPWRLSNNVATRPMMQDLMFPVLAFVGGPGEISYWALLKEAFHHIGIRMPILVPRISMTLVTPQARQAMKDLSLSVEEVLSGKVLEARELFIESLKNERFERALVETEKLLSAQYDELAKEADVAMNQLLEKNLRFHKKQLDYLREKSEEKLLLKNDSVLRKYGILENELLPDGSLQERIHTPYPFMNHYGPTLIRDLLQQPLKFDGSHQIIYL